MKKLLLKKYMLKIKYITENCKNLNEKDIDFIIRIISVMKEEYVKINSSLN